jgi:hypothetical protein
VEIQSEIAVEENAIQVILEALVDTLVQEEKCMTLVTTAIMSH